MGNSHDRHSCDTLAREITFKQFSSPEKPPVQHASKSRRETSMHRAKDDAVYRMPVRVNSRSRSSVKSRGMGSKSPAVQRANRILLEDMELECDGSMCRLVPRESLKRKGKADRKQSSKAKRLARERPNARSKSGNLNPLHITDATAKLATLEIPHNKGAKTTSLESDPTTKHSTSDNQHSFDSIDVIDLPEGLVVQRATPNIHCITDIKSRHQKCTNNNNVIRKVVPRPVKTKVTDIWKPITETKSSISDDELHSVHCELDKLMINQKVTEL